MPGRDNHGTSILAFLILNNVLNFSWLYFIWLCISGFIIFSYVRLVGTICSQIHCKLSIHLASESFATPSWSASSMQSFDSTATYSFHHVFVSHIAQLLYSLLLQRPGNALPRRLTFFSVVAANQSSLTQNDLNLSSNQPESDGLWIFPPVCRSVVLVINVSLMFRW